MATRTWTAGKTRTALRRFIRERAADSDRFSDDPVLAQLDAARWVASELDLIVRELVVAARRRDDKPRPWRLIGEAMGMTGQAAGKWAREHQLPVDRPDDAQLLHEMRALTAQAQAHGRWPRRRRT